MKFMPTSALCAHLYAAIGGLVEDKASIDALVSSIHCHSRVMDLCKEIAYLAKTIVSHEDIDLKRFVHLPLVRKWFTTQTSDDGIPYIKGNKWKALNEVLHSNRLADREHALILLTKLHCYILPLSVAEGQRRTRDMLYNISKPFDVDHDILERFRKYIKGKLHMRFLPKSIGKKGDLYDYNWHCHLKPLHDLSIEYMGSDKKRPCVVYDDVKGEFRFELERRANLIDAFMLPNILINKDIRSIYLDDKAEFMTLMSGKPVISVSNDEHLFRHPAQEIPIGRIGMRLQEAEKVRLLWMPNEAIEPLVQPIVSALEWLVSHSSRQTIYWDDSYSAQYLQWYYLNRDVRSRQTVYSIDQSNFTDNFPYSLQRIVLEELYAMGIIPMTSLKAFDLQVKGIYAPAPFFKGVEPVSFANGSPMGAYGCFMLSTLTHELLVEMLQTECNESPNGLFQGDDTVFNGDKSYESYIDTFKRLGCSVNEQKTMKSEYAAEYCGWIVTHTTRCPMFRPHDLFKDHPRDIASPRAIQAYGEDHIHSWVTTYRPEVYDFLRIEGLLPIRDDDNDREIILSARELFLALSKAKTVLTDGLTEQHRSRLIEIMRFYPTLVTDDAKLASLIQHEERSDFAEFTKKVTVLNGYINNLMNNPHCDLSTMCDRITSLSDDILRHHKDHIMDISPVKEQDDIKQCHRRDYKRDDIRASLDKTNEIVRVVETNYGMSHPITGG